MNNSDPWFDGNRVYAITDRDALSVKIIIKMNNTIFKILENILKHV